MTKLENEVEIAQDTFSDRNTLEIHTNKTLKVKILQRKYSESKIQS